MIDPMRLTTVTFLALTCLAFNISVKNESAQPIIVWLTKLGGPVEDGWRSPEDVAINFVVGEEPLGGVVVARGNTAETGQRKGKFDSGSRAVLRVYKGQMTLSEILANGSDSPNRTDVMLDPGISRFVVRDASGKLSVQHADAPVPPTTSR